MIPLSKLKSGTRLACACVLFGGSLPCLAEQTLGPVTDPIGVVRIEKDAPIQIGGSWVFTGADTSLGVDSRRGAELAFRALGDKLLDHPIKFNVEDDLCNAEGGQTAMTKLAANPQTVIVLGPGCSSAATPGSPILWQQGIANIATSATAPRLTSADRKPEYSGFNRATYSDVEQGASVAEYLFNVVKAKKVVAVHDGTPFGQQLATVMADNFKKLGGEILSIEAVSPTDVDMNPLLTHVAAEKPDAIYFTLFVAAGSQMLRQARSTAGLDNVRLLGSGSLLTPDFIQAAGAAAVGFQIGNPDLSSEALGKNYAEMLANYKSVYGEAPVAAYHAQSYDAAMLAARAIEATAKKDADGNLYIGRKALLDAIHAQKFDGMSGPIACDPLGQCARFKPAVYEFTNADPATFQVGTNPKRVWP